MSNQGSPAINFDTLEDNGAPVANQFAMPNPKGPNEPPIIAPEHRTYPSFDEAFGAPGEAPPAKPSFIGGAADFGAAAWADLTRRDQNNDGSSTPALDHYFQSTPAGQMLKHFDQDVTAPFSQLPSLSTIDDGKGVDFLKRTGDYDAWQKNHAATSDYFRNSVMRPSAVDATNPRLTAGSELQAMLPLLGTARDIATGYFTGPGGFTDMATQLRRDVMGEKDDLKALQGREFEGKIFPYIHSILSEVPLTPLTPNVTGAEVMDLLQLRFAVTGAPQAWNWGVSKLAPILATHTAPPNQTPEQYQQSVQNWTDRLNVLPFLVAPEGNPMGRALDIQRRLGAARRAGVIGQPPLFTDTGLDIKTQAKREQAQQKATGQEPSVTRPAGVPEPNLQASPASVEAAPAPAETPARDVHGVAREMAPDLFTQYDPLAARHAWYTNWINELRAARDNDPRLQRAQDEIDSILAKVNGVEDRLTNRQLDQIADIRGGMQDFINTDTPDMLHVKEALFENFQQMAPLQPEVQAAYRAAAERMTNEAEARGQQAPVETAPVPPPEPEQQEMRISAIAEIEEANRKLLSGKKLVAANEDETAANYNNLREGLADLIDKFHAAGFDQDAPALVNKYKGVATWLDWQGASGFAKNYAEFLRMEADVHKAFDAYDLHKHTDNVTSLVRPIQTAGPTITDYVDRYLRGEGRGTTPEDLQMQQFAANHPQEIEAEFQRRASVGVPASPAPALPVETAHIQTTQDIATDVSRQFQAAGSSKEASDAWGAIAASHYESRARRLGGAVGTGADLYRLEGPVIQGGARAPRPGQRTFGQRAAAKAVDIAKQVPGLRQLMPDLSEAERSGLAKRAGENLVDVFGRLPKAQEVASVAYSGRAKRGWYRNAAQAIHQLFGPADADRFTALLAGMSPQTSVESNLLNALKTWTNWDKEGRPTDPAAIKRILGQSVEGSGTEASVMEAWVNNSIRALTHDDPAKLEISGPKVNSFMQNLRGYVDEVTNDSWMATYAALDPSEFAASRRGNKFDQLGKTFGFKSPGYLAMSAVVRRASKILTERTGETWTPAEVQETVWSWAKALYERRDRAGEDRTVNQILAAGDLTHEDVAGASDFTSLLIRGVYSKILEEGGYGDELESIRRAADERAAAGGPTGPAVSVTGAEGSGLAQPAFERHLRQAGARLERVYTSRLAEGQQLAKAARDSEIRANLSAATPHIPGIQQLADAANAGDVNAGRIVNLIAHESLTRLMSGIPGVKLEATYNNGLYDQHLEPSLGLSVQFPNAQRGPVLAALGKFAENFHQREIHVRQETIDEIGRVGTDGSYATPVYHIELKTPLTREEVQAAIDVSGLHGITFNDKEIEAYFVGPRRNAKARAEFNDQIEKLVGHLGDRAGRVGRAVDRFWAYGHEETSTQGTTPLKATFPQARTSSPKSQEPSPNENSDTK